MRTSYRVGSKYQKAVDDYFQSKKNSAAEIIPEIIELETFDDSETEKITDNKVQGSTIDIDLIREMIKAQRVNFIYDIFQMSKFQGKNQFENTLKHGRNLIIGCLNQIFRSYLANDGDFDDKINDLPSFIEYLVKNRIVLFTGKDLEKYLEMSEKLFYNKSDSESAAADLIELIKKFELQLFYYI